nr:hypothetical protein [Tanacetum cinerariifolium]
RRLRGDIDRDEGGGEDEGDDVAVKVRVVLMVMWGGGHDAVVGDEGRRQVAGLAGGDAEKGERKRNGG